jgi:18S rRNA (adenine1779-N6/adenine1780-N6)-dimethyltransferase
LLLYSEYAHKLKIIHGDFLKIELPYFDVCVANTPYQISSPLTFKLLAHRPMFRAAVLMFQKEFADRLVASPGSSLYCRLSVNTQLLSTASHVMKVSRNSFRPPPQVDSAVVRLEPKSPPPPINFVEWDGLIRLCFSRKNKTLGAIFKQNNVIDLLERNYKTYCALQGIPVEEDLNIKEKVMGVLNSLNFQEKRSSKLDLDDFFLLLDAFHKHNLHFS